MIRSSLLGASALTLVLGGCSTTFEQPDSGAEARASASLPSVPVDWVAANEKLGAVQAGWIAGYDDPALSQLVDEAQANNRDIMAAAAGIERAWALANQAGAALTPSVGLSADANRSGRGEGPSVGQLQLGLQASWEADVWGRIRSGQSAAIASAEAVEADVLAARQSLAAGVSTAYFLAIESNAQEDLARSIVESLNEIERITQVRADNGLATAQDLALIRSDLATAREQLTAVGGSRRDAMRALEVLLGRYPAGNIETRRTLPEPPVKPPAGLPSDLLERRPDIVAAERRIAASIAGVNQSKAAKLPQISLTASVGGASNQLSNMLDPANVAWRTASSLLVPIIDGDVLDQQIVASQAEQSQAVAAYAQAALNAFQDVEGSLDQSDVLSARRADLEIALSEAKEALRIAQLRYEAGESDLIDVLTVRQRVDSTESNLLNVKRSQLANFASLNLALGGAWTS